MVPRGTVFLSYLKVLSVSMIMCGLVWIYVYGVLVMELNAQWRIVHVQTHTVAGESRPPLN